MGSVRGVDKTSHLKYRNREVKSRRLLDISMLNQAERELLIKTYEKTHNAKLTAEIFKHTREALPENEYFCVNLQVKQRYINPLVGSKRLSDISEKARRIIEDFKSFSDTPYGCVKLF